MATEPLVFVEPRYRRICFVGIVPLCSPLPATRASLGVVLGVASLAYFIDEKPYREELTNFIAVVAQYAILITYYAALAIETGVMVSFGLEDLGMGIFLCCTNLLVFGLVLGVRSTTKRAGVRCFLDRAISTSLTAAKIMC